eukprot:CAMPEP_0201483928 /NCGR_PEP_ID=MMETSP0151_2-20130828/8122_1 /ASSEMBLY_ACC=CAM_ASM_000257 /TAXON_ID=200890 /ORGANISM="Paramoeba atlantica, Strain 621/1 / CCAP 1560/9" /LENGTH=520 /DNA_ID=CAMNT_0047867319 /DNA_START=458 /DNA_END=2020 /DNA_ORIENTATION=+
MQSLNAAPLPRSQVRNRVSQRQTYSSGAYSSGSSLSVPEEEIPKNTSTPASSPSSSSSASSSSSNDIVSECLSLFVEPEKDRLSSKKSSTFNAIASLRAGKHVAEERAPLDIVAVVDRSGSMSGSKIQLVKEALSYLLTQLTSEDRLCVVSFDNNIYNVFGLSVCSPEGKKRMHGLVNGHRDMSAKGGTNISLGLQHGLECLKQRTFQNPVSAVMLLTDGQGGAPTDPALRGMLQGLENVPVHCFGFGRDHDSRTLNRIAEGAQGSFFFIEQLDSVGDAFATCLGSMLSVAAQDVVVNIRCEAEWARIQHISSPYPLTQAPDGRSAEIKVPDMLSEDKKDIVVTFFVDASEQPTTEEETPFFSANGTYLDPSAQKSVPVVLPKTVCFLPRPVDDSGAIVSLNVDRETNRIRVAETLKEAARLADGNKLSDARECLDAAIVALKGSATAAEPMIISLLDDLAECQERFKSRDTFQREGFAFAKMKQCSHSRQRAAGSKPTYANSCQMTQKSSNMQYRMNLK